MAELSPVEEIRQLREELLTAKKKLKKKEKMSQAGVFFKVSPKGAISVFGFGKYPLTYYANQWLGVFKYADAIKEFIIENQNSISSRA